MAKYKVYQILMSGSIYACVRDNLEDAEKKFESSLSLFHECMYKKYNNEYSDVWQTIRREDMHHDTVKAVLTKVENGEETVLKVEGIEYNYVKKDSNIDSEEEKNKLRKITEYFEGKVEIL